MPWRQYGIIPSTFYNKLRVQPEEHRILMTEPAKNPKSNTEKTIELLFEKFQTYATYLAQQAELAMYSVGKLTGTVVDIGHGKCEIVPVLNHGLISHAVSSSKFTGQYFDKRLLSYLTDRGHCFQSWEDVNTIREMKQQLCYVASDFDTENDESASDKEKSYQLPDGKKITLSNERFHVPEVMFQPRSFAEDSPGIHEILNETYSKLDERILQDVRKDTVLVGGGTMFPGFVDRLQIEMWKFHPSIRIIAPPERKCSVWIGGSILSSLSAFQSYCVTRHEYDEHGSNILHTKYQYSD